MQQNIWKFELKESENVVELVKRMRHAIKIEND